MLALHCNPQKPHYEISVHQLFFHQNLTGILPQIKIDILLIWKMYQITRRSFSKNLQAKIM